MELRIAKKNKKELIQILSGLSEKSPSEGAEKSKRKYTRTPKATPGAAEVAISSEVEQINSRIRAEFNESMCNELQESKLLPRYIQSPSFKSARFKWEQSLSPYMSSDNIKTFTQSDWFMNEIIQAGTKGVIRGNRFNELIKEQIMGFALDPEKYDVCFEKRCPTVPTGERPDWYICEKTTNKTLIGMNQLDLWSGGHQCNRGNKYVNMPFTDTSKVVSVVCNFITIKHTNNKTYELFKLGFENNTLCYPGGLYFIVQDFFLLNKLPHYISE